VPNLHTMKLEFFENLVYYVTDFASSWQIATSSLEVRMKRTIIALCLCSLLASLPGVPSAIAESPAYHVVQPGEGLWTIAIRYGLTIEALVQANKIVNPNWIYAGQVLLLPKSTQSGNGNFDYHTVAPGESLWSIATQYGVSAWSIVYKNGIANPDMIYAGQTLAIPSSSAGASSGKNPPPTAVPNPIPAKSAAKPFAAASFGYDISSPQCRNAFPSAAHAFSVIGINNGRTFRANNCFATEYDWAAKTSALTPSIYMNLSYPLGATAVNAIDGPAGRCGAADESCRAYNYGYNASRYSFNLAGRRNALVWWLDIELSNSWSRKAAMNTRVIQGAIDFFQNQGITVGAYSSVTQWSKIAGAGFVPKLTRQPSIANWVFGAKNLGEAPSFCSAEHAFGGGTVWLVQYPSGRFDGNYVCP
jgi:LysM repeat protein